MAGGSLVLAVGCGAKGVDTGASADADRWHVLASSLPASGSAGHGLWEVAADRSDRWTVDLDGGAMGAVRLDTGDTVLARTALPPELHSFAEAIDADGQLLWSTNTPYLGGIGFAHGVLPLPGGGYVTGDSVGGRVVGFELDAGVLWDFPVEAITPNGIAVLDADPVLIAVSLLHRAEDQSDGLLLLELGPDGPVERWRIDVATPKGGQVIPHGPRFVGGDTLTLCESATGQVVGRDLDGAEVWRVPDSGAADSLAFPRDTIWLPDGSIMVADAALELVHVADPLGDFEILGAVEMPGIFGLDAIDCVDRPQACLGT